MAAACQREVQVATETRTAAAMLPHPEETSRTETRDTARVHLQAAEITPLPPTELNTVAPKLISTPVVRQNQDAKAWDTARPPVTRREIFPLEVTMHQFQETHTVIVETASMIEIVTVPTDRENRVTDLVPTAAMDM
jgi:hypothetical protein